MNTHFENSSFDSPTTTKKVLLKASNLSHSFEYELYKGINIDIHEGESIAILGVSGSGKSTLLHNLSTLLKPKTGTITYNNRFLYDRDSKELLAIRRNEFGIIFQQHYLFKGFSVKENLDISSIIAKKEIDEELLREFGILQNLNQNVADLSGGQQQRVSIARVMMKKPKLIFADELTGNLDRETADEVMDVMIRYVKEENSGLFLVTHDEMVAKRCDKVYRLTNKRLELVTL
jgi:putative ABC transport system ATP-binding protein